MRYLLLARNSSSVAALSLWLEAFGEQPLANAPATDSRCLIWTAGKTGDLERTTKCYERAVKWIEREAAMSDGSLALNEVVVLIDRANPDDLNAAWVSDQSAVAENEWNSLLAMLILTFPEIYWAFGTLTCKDRPEWSAAHSLTSVISKARRDTLFDPTGLVQWVKTKTNSKLSKGGAKSADGRPMDILPIPIRRLYATAIDEEKSYAYLHAYTAYRNGFCADAVTSWALMSDRFNAGEGNHDYYLLIEDMNLNFPDKPDIHLSSPNHRAEKCTLLEKNECSSRRALITSGAETSDDANRLAEWQLFLGIVKPDCIKLFRRITVWVWSHVGRGFSQSELNKTKTTFFPKLWQAFRHPQATKEGVIQKSKGRILNKPVGGMFDLWKNLDLKSQAHTAQIQGRSEADGKLVCDGYVWPIRKSTEQKCRDQSSDSSNGDHSAPGKLMLVAETLLRRAEVFSKEACTVKDYIKGAVLATEALELLGGRTPTMSLVALGLKHQYEAQAECAFVGVGYHFDVKSRVAEIQRDVDVICEWFGARRRKESGLSAQVSILNRLVLVLRDAGRFEEENECLVALRRSNRELSYLQERNFKRCKLIPYWLRRYAEFLMVSFPQFLLVLFCWLLLGFVGWKICDSAHEWKAAISGTIGSFVGGNAAPSDSNAPNNLLLFWSSFLALAGLFHFGVFVSYLYSVVSRK